MRIGEAVYTLAAIRRTNGISRTRDDRAARPDTPVSVPAEEIGSGASSSVLPSQQGEQLRTLAEMLHGHFVEEIRIRDRDGDGLLSRSEFAGAAEEFDLLDADTDGLVGAGDLARAALEKNPGLSEIVAGPWAPVYNAILNSGSNDIASLGEAARAGASEALRKESTYGAHIFADGENNPAVPPGDDPADSSGWSAVEDLMAQFMGRHNRLDQLRARLDDLANRLGRFPRYHRIDRTA